MIYNSAAVNVHLQSWTLNGQQVILSKGTNLTMTLDKNGIIRDQNGDIAVVSKADGSIDFIPASAVTNAFITGPWSSNPSQNAAINLPAGYVPYGCANTTASAYQMFAFTTSPAAMPSCTNVLLQVSLC